MSRSAACLVALWIVAAPFAAQPAWTKEPAAVPGAAEVAKATIAAKAGRLGEAGELLAKAVALSVKAKSLEGEQQAVEALERLLDGVESDASIDARGDASADTRPGRGKARDLAAAVLKGLDAKRRGVYVSAHALAIGLVLDAVAVGDDAYLAEAAQALAAFASTAKSGAAGGAFARLSEGVVAARAGDVAKATWTLGAVAAELEGRGWVLPSLYARLEIAALQLAANDAVKAFAALQAAVVRLPKEPDLPSVQEWLHAVEVRAKGAPAESLDAFRKATQHLLGGSAGMAGGRGGAGGQGGGGDVSPVGRVLPTWPTGKPFVTAKLSAAGFQCVLPFDDQSAADVPLASGQGSWDSGGVTLLLAGPAVALGMVDVTGLAGQPGGRSRASRARAFYWLAVGEVFAATKSGIEITGHAAALTAR